MAFANVTMAKIYLAQGQFDKAQKMLGTLLQAKPQDPKIKGLMKEVSKKQAEAAASEATSTYLAGRLDRHRLLLSWQMDADGPQRAHSLLQTQGLLTLRIVQCFGTTPKQHTDIKIDSLEGTYEFDLPEHLLLVISSVGICTPEAEFASIVHTPPLEVAR